MFYKNDPEKKSQNGRLLRVLVRTGVCVGGEEVCVVVVVVVVVVVMVVVRW